MITRKSATDSALADVSPAHAAPRREAHKTKRASNSTTVPKAKQGSRPQSKQECVLTMLRQREGTTIQAVMRATGWQKHSVHGFLSGVVRKKLKLKLESTKVGDERIYRIVGEASPKASRRPHAKRRSA